MLDLNLLASSLPSIYCRFRRLGGVHWCHLENHFIGDLVQRTSLVASWQEYLYLYHPLENLTIQNKPWVEFEELPYAKLCKVEKNLCLATRSSASGGVR